MAMAGCHCGTKLVIFLLFTPHIYSHYVAEPNNIIRGVWSSGKPFLTRRSLENSLKIKAFPDSSIQKLSSDLRKLVINRLLPDAITYFSRTLSVRQRISPLRLQRDCKKSIFKSINGTLFRHCQNECKNLTYCGTVLIPEAHLDVCKTCDSSEANCTNSTPKSAGLTSTDFALYVSAIATPNCNNQDDLIAFASTCQQEQTLDRPVAGFVHFCANKLSRDYHYSHLLAVVKHEIFHAIGFSSSLYGYFRADDGSPLTPRLSDGRPTSKWSDKVIKEITRNHWKVSKRAGSSVSHSVKMIVTGRVVKEVRSHFNCPSLEGAEIENQGSSGRRYTHLEKRVFENEAMTGIFTNNPVFSRITLALMEDSGWYVANYKMAESFDWGQSAGCLFAQNSCKAWMDHQTKINGSISPYCTQLSLKTHTQTGCTHSYHGVGICNMVKYVSPLPLVYQYFDSLPGVNTPDRYGGKIMLADYCPYYQEVDWKNNGKRVRGSSCKHESNKPSSDKNYSLEMYGEYSSCFLQGKAWTKESCSKIVTAVDWGSGCYLFQCSIEGLLLSISGQSYQCNFPGQVLDISIVHNRLLHKGSIVCPACEALCGSSCPLVESTYPYNSSFSEKHQNPLVCLSVNFHPNFVMLVFFILLTMLIVGT